MVLYEWYEDAQNIGEQRLIKELEETRIEMQLQKEAEEKQILVELESMRCEDDLERFDFVIKIQEEKVEGVVSQDTDGTYI